MIARRTISHKDRQPNLDAITDASTAQFQLWLAQAKHDHGDMSGRELARVEAAAKPIAANAIALYNPFTGEIRKVDLHGNLLAR